MDLTLEEKDSLCLGSDIWHTAPEARAHGAITGDLGVLRQLVLQTQRVRRYEPALSARPQH